MEQVDTNTFQNWFEGSKVLDAQGQPLVVFHGTSSHFDVNEFYPLSHFGSIAAANHFSRINKGHVFPVYLNIKQPLYIGDLGSHTESTFCKLFSLPSEHALDEIIPDLLSADELEYCFPNHIIKCKVLSYCFCNKARKTVKNIKEIDTSTSIKEDIENSVILHPQRQNHSFVWIDRMVRVLEAKGYDGFIYKNTEEDRGSYSFIPFRQSQVKSAISL